MIPYGRQTISDADINAVIEVLHSAFLTQGPAVPRFESALAARVAAKHAVAVNSATSALHLACLALGLGPGDIMWTVPNSFVASANAALYCGAAVDFVDIESRSYLMDIDKLEEKLVAAERLGKLPKIVMPVHFAGQSCDMMRIAALASRYGFHVLEDAAQALGAQYRGRPVGSCGYSDIAVFSFHPVKTVTTGEGGVSVTNRPELAERMRLLRSHGITRDQALMSDQSDGPWYYQQIALGFNYRMTDIQAALGVSQLTRLDEFIELRRAIATRYNRLLSGTRVTRPWQDANGTSAWHLYIVALDDNSTDRSRVYAGMHARGIAVQVFYIPIHTQPFYATIGFKAGDFPVAERHYARSFSLPIFPSLTETEQEEVISALKECIG